MNRKVSQIQSWLELAERSKWSVSSLAQNCNVSTRTLEIYFIKRFHQAPKRWLIAQRQKQAARILCDGLFVKEVAAQLGYRHFNHFSRDFKKHWGFSPGQFNLKMNGGAGNGSQII